MKRAIVCFPARYLCGQRRNTMPVKMNTSASAPKTNQVSNVNVKIPTERKYSMYMFPTDLTAWA